jgi:hypothetical protein
MMCGEKMFEGGITCDTAFVIWGPGFAEPRLLCW